jgi:hypothetical protein
MTLNTTLVELIQRIATQDVDYVISWDQAQDWPEGALSLFKQAGLIKPAPPAHSVECPGCEENCFMPVHVLPAESEGLARAYVVCDQKDYMGHINILLERLKQWQITAAQVANVLSGLLGMKGKPEKTETPGITKIGIIQGKKKSGWLELDATPPVFLRVSGHSIPLSDILYFKRRQLEIDRDAIVDLADRPPPKNQDRYQPSTARREARKLDTAERHESWRKEGRKLRKTHPDKSERWIAQYIGKMPIAGGASCETIRKNIRQ